jgi:hypothetical protein
MDAREERIARNEVLFREVNERITEIADPPREARIEIFCECGLDDCTERIEVGVRDYEMVRAEPTRFVLREGHEISDVEDVVISPDGYLIVEKRGRLAVMARETDPRSDR